MSAPLPHPSSQGSHGLRSAARGAGMALAALLFAGCSNPVGPGLALKHPPGDLTAGPPAADTPEHLLMRLRWAWEHQDCATYDGLFTDDYVFAFAAEDSAANSPLTRGDELRIGCHIFAEGTPTEPRAKRITLVYASELVARPDRRPGKTYPWHQELSVRVILRVETDDIVHSIEGKALFFVVRADSARIPEDLRQRGLGPDPNRWFIERWEDQTGGDAFGTSSPRGATSPRATAAAPPWGSGLRLSRSAS